MHILGQLSEQSTCLSALESSGILWSQEHQEEEIQGYVSLSREMGLHLQKGLQSWEMLLNDTL